MPSCDHQAPCLTWCCHWQTNRQLSVLGVQHLLSFCFRSYFPVFPPPPGALLDTSLAAEALQLPVTPDVLLVPSELAPFAQLLPAFGDAKVLGLLPSSPYHVLPVMPDMLLLSQLVLLLSDLARFAQLLPAKVWPDVCCLSTTALRAPSPDMSCQFAVVAIDLQMPCSTSACRLQFSLLAATGGVRQPGAPGEGRRRRHLGAAAVSGG